MSRQALLKAILDDPCDDIPRLILADWLEENGEADRAALIRVQCRLAQLEEWAPEHYQLEREEAYLFALNRGRWLQEVPKAIRRDCAFRRGFVGELEATPTAFLRSSSLWRRAPIESVRLRGVAGRLKEVLQAPHLSRVRSLYIVGPRLHRKDIRALAESAALGGLTALDLDGAAIGPEGAAELVSSPHLTRLTRLSLPRCRLGADGVRAVVSSPIVGHLRSLGLSDNAIGTEGARAVAGAAGLGDLRTLDLSDFHGGAEGALAVLRSSILGRLCDLDLAYLVFSGDDMRRLSECPGLARLRRLRLTGVDDAGAATLASCSLLAGLVRLDLSCADVREAGAAAFTRSPYLRELRGLDLSFNFGFKQDAVRALAKGPLLCQLRELRLDRCHFGDEGVRTLLGAGRLDALHKLDLGYNSVTAEGARALAAHQGLAQLYWLSLQGNDIQPEGAAALAKASLLERLAYLDLSQTNIGLEGGQAVLESPYLSRVGDLHLRRTWIFQAALKARLTERFGERVHF
jgi:uncharacterized protein (TIGR02996 family)